MKDVDIDIMSVRTDLAMEAREVVSQRTGADIPGVESQVERIGNAVVTRVRVLTEEAGRAMGKMRGTYITIECQQIRTGSREIQEEISRLFAKEIVKLVDLKPDSVCLICGLGNWNATPDALGPRVVSRVMVTRHLYELSPPELRGGMRPVCAIAPGVLGITGMETGEVIQGVVEKIRPDAVFVVDALASRSTTRLGTTIQMGDTGIQPGSGVGNKRFGVTRETLGVPVVAVGVPTVVDAITIASDAMDLLARETGSGAPDGRGDHRESFALNPEQKRDLLRQVLAPHIGHLIVTPKEIDDIIDEVSSVIAGGFNVALHPKLDLDKVFTYLQ